MRDRSWGSPFVFAVDAVGVAQTAGALELLYKGTDTNGAGHFDAGVYRFWVDIDGCSVDGGSKSVEPL